MIEAGIRGRKSVVVEEGSTAAAMGSGTLQVFATPAMVALIEATASESVAPFLEEGQSTVGTRLDISHSAPSPVGAGVVCETELVEVDRRRLVFRATVRDGAGEVGSGTHERFVVDDGRFMSKAASRLRSDLHQEDR
ncbi:MAG: thioesterase family protein [Candidatus Methanomethylophilaceae archaeon]|nr:thioesterase family protein [Candidatus Methanomethylophilaceae archaeon]